MRRIYRILAVMALFMVFAAFVPVVHAYYNTMASSYGSKNNQYMTAYNLLDPSETQYTGIECRLVDASSTPVGSAVKVTTSTSASNPAVAYDTVLDRFLVAWTEYNAGVGDFVVRGRILSSDGSLAGDEIAITDSTDNQTTVKIAYSPSSGRYLVVFGQGSPINVMGRFVDGDGALYGESFTAIPGASYAETPGIAYDSVNHRFLIAALTHGGSYPPMSMVGTIITDDMAVFKSPFTILDSSAYLYPPAIAFDPVNSRFLVIWEVYGGTGHQLWGQLVNADGTLNGSYQVIVPSWTVDFANDVVYQSGNGRFFTAWYSGGIYGQEVNSDGTNYGASFSIVNPSVQRDLALAYNTNAKNTLVAYKAQNAPYFTTFPPCSLTVTKAGSGMGTVASDPAGISCGDGCITASHSFACGQEVTLTASTGSGYAFDYWSGACEGTLSSCKVTVTGDLTVRATFVPSTTKRVVLTVSRSKVNGGDGTIQSHDQTVNCGPGGATCKNSYYRDTPVTLSATAKTGSVFSGWKPATLCPGTGDCPVVMDKAKSIQAVFVGPQKLTVSKQNKDKGDGRVVSSPVGIDCGTGCAKAVWPYSFQTSVTLHPTADTGSVFSGWKPATLCPGTGDCTVVTDKAKSIQAVFVGPQKLTVKKQAVKGGSGTVDSSPVGIDCGSTCKSASGLFPLHSSVTLHPTADTGSVFSGWKPATLCPGTGGCTIPMEKAYTVTAVFTSIAGSGQGAGE